MKRGNKPFKLHEELEENGVIVKPYYRHKSKQEYDRKEWIKYLDACILSKVASSSLKEVSQEGITIMAFEGFSYQSKGRGFDLAVYSMVLKNQLAQDFNVEFRTVPPSKLKNSIGAKGNAGKPDVVKAFAENKNEALSPLDPVLLTAKKVTSEWEHLEQDPKEAPKPLDDLVDAYGACKWLEERLKSDGGHHK